MVLPRQGTDYQIQPETRVDHGKRTPVLEPYPRNVLPRVRPSRPRTETHGEEHRTIEHGTVVVRHRIRHLPGAASLPAKGLKALGREYHLKLAATVLVIWGLTSFIPGMIGIKDGFLGLIYLFILIAAYKWYMEPFTTRQVWLMIGTGLGFFLLYTCASITLSLLGHDMGIYINRRFAVARHHSRLRNVPAV